VAGEPGDRRLKLKEWRRKAAAAKPKREESPDTVARQAVCERRKASAEWSTELTAWATRLVTPGDEVEVAT